MRFYKAYTLTHEFRHLPAFSQFLLDKHLSELVELQLIYSREAEIPLLKQLSHLSDEELIAFSIVSMTEFLQHLAANRTEELIELSLARWKADQLGIIGKFEIMAEDIYLINYIRGKSFRKFISSFTNDINTAVETIDELDSFFTGSTIASMNMYIVMMREQLASHERNLLEAQRLSHIGSFDQDFVAGKTKNSPELHRIFNMAEGTRFEEFMQYIHPDDQEKVMKAYMEAKSTGHYECEYRYVKDGISKNIWSKGVMTFENGEPIKFFGTVQDITERKATEQLMIDNAHALARSNESLQQFAYVASHDLKEPLRKVSMLTDRVLTTEKNLSAATLDKLAKIQRSADRMRQMIDAIMNYSTLEQWEDKRLCDLNQVVAEVIELLEQVIEEKNANIKVNDLPEAVVIPAQFRQLFQNLIGNALKFSRPNIPPEISITAHWLKSAPDEFNLPPAAKYLKVDVTDKGIGFSQEYANRIFMLFSRLQNKNEYEGSGLGLAIARKIIENHKGVIYANSRESEETTFSFIIPQ